MPAHAPSHAPGVPSDVPPDVPRDVRSDVRPDMRPDVPPHASPHAPPTPARAPARLLIHAAPGAGPDGGRLVEALRRWRAWAGDIGRQEPGCQALLQVADLQGRPLFFVHEGQGPVDVLLPPGTYHVIVDRGTQQRRYTVALEPGSTFNLHLRGAPAAR